MKQLMEFPFRSFKSAPSGGRCAILAPGTAAGAFRGGAKIAPAFQAVEHRVQRARAQPVAVPAQFLHHPEANQGFFGGVVKNVEADEARQEVQLVLFFQP